MLDEGKAEAEEERRVPRPDQNYKVASFFHIANCHVSVMGRRAGIDGTSRRKNISPGGKIKKRMRERKREAFLMMASSFAFFWRFGKLGKRTNWLQGRGLMWCLAMLPSVAAIFRGRKSVVLSPPPSLARVFWVRFAELLLRSAAAADYWKNVICSRRRPSAAARSPAGVCSRRR